MGGRRFFQDSLTNKRRLRLGLSFNSANFVLDGHMFVYYLFVQ